MRLRSINRAIWSIIYFSLKKIRYGKRIDYKINKLFTCASSTRVEFAKRSDGYVKIGRRLAANKNFAIKVREGGNVTIGSNVSFGENCTIVCHDEIVIGDGCEFGPNIMIYDHDHDYRSGLKKKIFCTSPVHIGADTWVGANTMILSGTNIGANCVVGAGAIVAGKSYDDNTVIIQKRIEMIKTYKVTGENDERD